MSRTKRHLDRHYLIEINFIKILLNISQDHFVVKLCLFNITFNHKLIVLPLKFTVLMKYNESNKKYIKLNMINV